MPACVAPFTVLYERPVDTEKLWAQPSERMSQPNELVCAPIDERLPVLAQGRVGA